MNTMSELEELQAYRRKIWEDANGNLHDGISRINDTLAMFSDFQEICNVMFEMARKQQEQLDGIFRQNQELKVELQKQAEQGRNLKNQNEQFAALGLDAAKVSSLMISLDRQKKKLISDKEELEKQKAGFEEEKKELGQRTLEVEERVRKLKNERDQAIVDRDETIKKLRTVENSLTDREGEIRLQKRNHDRELKEVKNQVGELEKERKWYKEYAAALDRKVIDWYEERNRDLDSHYHNYLNDPHKWPEHREHFPEYQKDCVLKETEDMNNSKAMVEVQESGRDRRSETCRLSDPVSSQSLVVPKE